MGSPQTSCAALSVYPRPSAKCEVHRDEGSPCPVEPAATGGDRLGVQLALMSYQCHLTISNYA
jgi:hypothetical protein